MGGLLTVPSDTTIDEQGDDPLARLRKLGILRSALAGGGDLPYQRVAAPITPAAAGTGLSDEAADPPLKSLLDDASAEPDDEEETPTLIRPGEDQSGQPLREPDQPSLLRPGEFPGEGEPQNEPAYNPLAEQSDIAGGRARGLQQQQQALEHPSLKNRLIRALVEAAPIAVGALAGHASGLGAGVGAGVGGEASLEFQGEQEREKELEENRLQQEMELAQQQQGTLATQASLQGERQRRDQAYIDEQNALAHMHDNAQPREDPMEGKTVTLGDEVDQWDPETKRYDIPVGKPKTPARGGKGWTLEYGKDGSPIALRDPQGDLHQPDEQDIPAPVQTLWTNAVANAQQSGVAPEIGAQTGPKPTSNSYNGKKYPNIKAAQAAWGADVEKHKEAEASAAGESRGAAFGRNRPVEVLDTYNGNRPIRVSAGEQEDNPDRYVNATGGAKALQGQVTMDDIKGALENVRANTKVLDSGTFQRAKIAAVLADPQATATSFAQSAVADQLSPKEQDYVIAVLTAREVIPGIRTLLGTGQGSDSRVRLMLTTLPGARTPSSAYANKQIDSSLATLKRVRPAVPQVAPQNNRILNEAGGGGADPLGIR